MSYVGNVPTTAAFPFDQFSGNGSTTAFTLSYAPAGTTSIIVSISGVVQNPNTYSVSGTTLTFTPAPPTGTNNIAVLYLGLPVVASMTGTMGFIAGSATNPPIYPIGDTNTGIFFPAADTVAIGTGGTEALRVNSSQQVGVGTTSTLGNSLVNVAQGVVARNSGSVLPYFQTYNSNAGTDLKTWRFGGNSSGALAFETVNDAYSSATGRMLIDSSGNVGIGGAPSADTTYKWLNIYGPSTSGGGIVQVSTSDSAVALHMFCNNLAGYIGTANSHPFLFRTNSIERARIDTSGRLLVNATADMNAGKFQVNGDTDVSALFKCANNSVNNIRSWMATASGTRFHVAFADGTTFTERGSISTNGTSTTYSTSSDYRLKENITPITGAMAKVAQMRPVDWTWKENGAAGQGFIAHELQAVIPDAVVGEKDEVDENGNPRYQSVDTSFLVATLTAAIQEQQAMIDELKAKVATLEGAA